MGISNYKKDMYERALKSPTEIRNWWPLVKDLSNINSPFTQLVPVPLGGSGDTHKYIHSKNFPRKEDPKTNYILGEQIIQQCMRAFFLLKSKFPEDKEFFLKTGSNAGKHSWSHTCLIKREFGADELEWLLYSQIEEQYMSGRGTTVIDFVFRQMIPTNHVFTAFGKGLPINPEVRVFYVNGKVEYLHPYWPPSAIRTSERNWEHKLQKMNQDIWKQRELLSQMGQQVGEKLKSIYPNWSIDFLQDSKGKWWLIDVGEAEKSFRWDNFIENNYPNVKLEDSFSPVISEWI